jgi:hypothetical protein
MTGFRAKTYIVQKASGEVIAAKTAYGPAHTVAKENAPARILFAIADKSGALNVSDYDPDQARATNCKPKR